MKRPQTARAKQPRSARPAVSARRVAALEARIAELEQKIAKLELRDEALDHSIEELAAAWAAESK